MKYVDEIKSAIAEVIKPNGNQEITGQVLQDILVSVVGRLGQSFDSQIGEHTDIRDCIKIGTYTSPDPTIKIGNDYGTPINIGASNQRDESISILGSVYIDANFNAGENVSIGTNFNAGENATIGVNFNAGNNTIIGTNFNAGENATIGTGVNIGGNVTIGNNVAIGSGGVLIPGGLTIGFDNNNGNYYLGTGIPYSTDTANKFMQIAYSPTGITFKTPNGQITLNYDL